MGIPFIPVRGILGSDYLRVQPRFKVIRCPFSGHQTVVVEAITPDVSVIHALKADERGNVLIERHSDVDLAVKAAKKAIATVEEVVKEGELVGDEKTRLISWINFYAIVHVPFGAHPVSCPGYYCIDRDHMTRYVKMAADEELFRTYLKNYIYDLTGHDDYIRLVKQEGWRPQYRDDRDKHSMSPGKGDYTLDELIMTLIAREVNDGTCVAIGTLSPVPAAGCILASLTTAPHVKLIILGDPDSPLDRGSSQLFDMAQRGLIDLFFLSFVQMDGDCNLNLTVIGEHQKPLIRFPGGAGSSMLYHMAKKIIMFKMSHTKRDFVSKVDFITCSGFNAGLNDWQRPGGPYKIITNLAVMRADRERKRVILESVHPGVSPRKVVENTGFEIEVPSSVPETEPPNTEQLEILRTKVREKLAGIYREYSRRW
nr:hypothetical protein [Desulfobacterales bacterium]